MNQVKWETSQNVSERIDAVRFPLICLVVLLHSHEHRIRFSSGETVLEFPFWFQWVTETIYNVVFRVAVPAFFIISGFLLFFNSREPGFEVYGAVRRRLNRLLPAYLVWNLLFLALVLVAQSYSSTGQLFSGHSIQGLNWNLLRTSDICLGITRMPLDGSLWFVRNLMILLTLSRGILWVFRCVPPWATASFVGLLVAGDVRWSSEWGSLPGDFVWFSVGGWFGFRRQLPELGGAGLGLATLIYALAAGWHGYLRAKHVAQGWQWVTIPLGLLVAWSWTSVLNNKPKSRSLLIQWSRCSFFIFAVHGLLMSLFRKVLWKWLHPQSTASEILTLYLLVPSITLAISLGAYQLSLRLPRSLRNLLNARSDSPRLSHTNLTVPQLR